MKKFLRVILGAALALTSAFTGAISSYSEEAKKDEWDLSLDSLAETYKDYFYIGNIMEPGQMGFKNTGDMFIQQYNYVTPENCMKPLYIAPAKGKYNFGQADAFVKWANDNNIHVHGHTLVWHSQSAKWLNTNQDGTPLTREEAKANMEEYINEVASHYKGKVKSWDVVNEAFLTSVDSMPTDWRSKLRRHERGDGSMWFAAYENGADAEKGEHGADYIYDAYVFARLADPGAKLYYNDFNETTFGKRESIAMMVTELNEQWKTDERNTEPERLLIEGIGMQAHYWVDDISIKNIEASIQRFAQTGADVSITELDIPFGNYATLGQRKTPPTEEELALQADLFRQVMEVCVRNADKLERVTFWGKMDQQSWRAAGYPLLFDRNFQPKPAFDAILDVGLNYMPEPAETEEVTTTSATDVSDDVSGDESEANADNSSDESPAETTTSQAEAVDASSSSSSESFALLPVIIIAAVVLVGGGIVAVIFLSKKKN